MSPRTHLPDTAAAAGETNQPLHDGLDGAALPLRPVRVAHVLRALQARVAFERDVALTLEVDESVHIAAEVAVLTRLLIHLVHSLLDRDANARIVASCRTDAESVLVELEQVSPDITEPSPGLQTDQPSFDSAFVEDALKAMNAELRYVRPPSTGLSLLIVFTLAPSGYTSSVPPSDIR